MRSKAFRAAAYVGLLVLAVSIGVVAQGPVQGNFSGLINDYTPATLVNPAGPWEVRGEWFLAVHGDSGTAQFTATLTMVRSDYWVLQSGDPDDPQGRTPHTHHITVLDGMVTTIQNGFEVTGTATIMANGNPAGFSPSPITIDITGGTGVPYSNIKVTFGSPASGHFGTFPLDGIVRRRPNE